MVPHDGKEKGTKETMGLCCKLCIRINVNDSFFKNSVNGGIPLKNVTGETVHISKYLDSGFYDKFRFKDNDGISPIEPVRWLWISHQTGRLMCYHILTHTGKVIYIYTVQRVTNLELYTDEVKETFVKFDT